MPSGMCSRLWAYVCRAIGSLVTGQWQACRSGLLCAQMAALACNILAGYLQVLRYRM